MIRSETIEKAVKVLSTMIMTPLWYKNHYNMLKSTTIVDEQKSFETLQDTQPVTS